MYSLSKENNDDEIDFRSSLSNPYISVLEKFCIIIDVMNKDSIFRSE